MQPAMYSFWKSYVRQKKLDTAASNRWLLRSLEYGAARLIQRAFEETQVSMQLPNIAVWILQLSLNMLGRPQEAIAQLLGIPLAVE
jgi:hypothetical protein